LGFVVGGVGGGGVRGTPSASTLMPMEFFAPGPSDPR
jgi:hypothetical protein